MISLTTKEKLYLGFRFGQGVSPQESLRKRVHDLWTGQCFKDEFQFVIFFES